MPLPAGTKLGPYEVVAPLGAGGMGEVYRAQDTRLDRTVAIKILPEALAGNAQFRERFDREARAVSSLNHPHICTLYDIGQQDGLSFLVMEHLEGETLAARLQKGPLPVQETLRFAIEIAEALDAAHRKGVFHRDLKPGNIFVTKNGIKLLDFGLAKLRDRGGETELTRTLTKALTQEGAILGTPQYMAPEQIEGAEADARTDIFAFGIVLFEMLTGKRAFEGKTSASVMAAILHIDPPNVSTLQPVTPPNLERVVKVCLEKNPDDRWQTARDLLRELQWLSEPGAVAASTSAPPARKTVFSLAALCAFLVFAVLGISFVHFRESRPEAQVLRYTVAAPEKTVVNTFALSPDGRFLAIAATGEHGRQLWLRALDAFQPQALPGTEGALYPFWSPDSRSIGFFAQGKLKKISANGGPAQTLCDAPEGRGGTWSREDVIVFAPANTGGLSRVAAAGGVPTAVTKPEGGSDHRFPVFLPDGSRFFYLVSQAPKEKNGIYLASLDGHENRRMVADESSPIYVPPLTGSWGHLLFVRESTLMAQPVDSKTIQVAGDLFPAAEQVLINRPNTNYAQFSASANGLLIWQTGRVSEARQLVWFDRSGKELSNVGEAADMGDHALSPDGKSVVVERLVLSGTTQTSNLWLYDLEHRTDSRFTFDASTNRFPVWSPDGSRVAYSSSRTKAPGIYQRAANGAGQDELLLPTNIAINPYDWSRDGRFLLYMISSPKTLNDLWALPLAGDRKPIPLLQSEFNEWMGQLSPDGRWLAYDSDESGRAEVYIQPFTVGLAAGSAQLAVGKWQISTGGGTQPRWRGDGKEVFFVAADRRLMAADLKTGGSGIERGTPQPLFTLPTPVINGIRSGRFIYRYSPSSDGKRFLVSKDIDQGLGVQPLNVAVNWLSAIKK